MSRYVVMTASAHMPARARALGTYKRVAVVETDLEDGVPKMISTHANGVKRIVKTWERLNVGTTERCAYRQALAEAGKLADRLNGVSEDGGE